MSIETLPVECAPAATRFLTEKELAELLRIAPSSVRNIRARAAKLVLCALGSGAVASFIEKTMYSNSSSATVESQQKRLRSGQRYSLPSIFCTHR